MRQAKECLRAVVKNQETMDLYQEAESQEDDRL